MAANGNRHVFPILTIALIIVCGMLLNQSPNKTQTELALTAGHGNGAIRLHLDGRASTPAEIEEESIGDTLTRLANMKDVELCPDPMASPAAKRRAGWAMCNIAAFALWDEGCQLAQSDEPEAEPFRACLGRFGPTELAAALPSKCRDSYFFDDVQRRLWNREHIWRKTNAVAKTQRRPGPWLRDSVIRSSLVEAPDAMKPRPYVPPASRPGHDPAKVPKKECPTYTAWPISFGMPEENIASEPLPASRRAWDFFPYLRPYNLSVAIPYLLAEQDELVIQQVYRMSHYAFTSRRGGWDCWRHLEVMAAGTLPFMPDLAQCDRLCLALYPKALFEEILQQPEVRHIGSVEGPHVYWRASENATRAPANPEYLVTRPELAPPTHVNPRKVPRMRRSELDAKRFEGLARRALAHVREYQTTKAVVSYVLRVLGHEEPRSVLLVTRQHMDYMEFTIEHGLASLGINYTATSLRDWIRHYPNLGDEMLPSAEVDDRRNLLGFWRHHGKGIGYGFRVPNAPVIEPGSELRNRILAREFDLIIYPFNMLNDAPFLSEARDTLGKGRVAIIDGHDNLQGMGWAPMLEIAASFGTVFHRELEGGCG